YTAPPPAPSPRTSPRVRLPSSSAARRPGARARPVGPDSSSPDASTLPGDAAPVYTRLPIRRRRRTAMEVPLLVTDFFRRAARHYPTKLALVDGPRRYGWRDLEDRIDRFSSALLALGLRP